MAVNIQSNVSHISPTKLFTPGVIALLILTILGFILKHVAPDFTFSFLALTSRGIIKAKLWQLVTYPFINIRPIDLVFSILVILFIGSDIERQWRMTSFLMLWLVVSVISGILWVLITSALGGGYIGVGTAACTYGMVAAFGMLNRGRKTFVLFAVMEAQYLVILLIALGIILNITQPIGLIWILGAPVAYLYIKLRWRLAERSMAAPGKSAGHEKNRFVDID